MTNTECIINVTTNSQWITPLAIILSAIIGSATAFFAIKHHREVARMRATLDIIQESESNSYYQKIYASFRSETHRAGGLKALVNAKSDMEKQSRRDINDFLNHYELIAIAINNKILDEKFYKNWMKSTYIKHFDESKEYINSVRADLKAPNSFVEYEKLVTKWKNPRCKC